MAVAYNPKVVTDGLRHCTDGINQKSYVSGNTITDLVTRASGTISIPNAACTWMNNGVNTITVTIALTRLTDNAGYAFNPFQKYAGTATNTFNIYIFGNNAGGQPSLEGNLRMYANVGGTWGDVGSNYNTVIGRPVIATWQYNSTTGGQLWINGAKVGTRTRTGIFGSSNTADLIIYPPTYSPLANIHYTSIYDRELVDVEVQQIYTALRGRYSL